MPELWYAAFETLGEAAATDTAATTATAAAADAAAADAAATTAATAATASELGALSQAPGIGAQLAPTIEGATAIGGEGAGSAGIQTAMQNTMQQAPLQFTGEVAPQGITQVPSPDQYASINTGTVSDAGNGMRMPTGQGPNMSGYDRVNSLMDSSKLNGIAQAAPQAAPEMTNAQFYDKLAADPGSGFAPQTEPSSLAKGWDAFSKFAGENKMLTGMGAYTAAYNLGWLDPRGMQQPSSPYDGPLNRYRMSDKFQAGGNETNTNQYKPTYPSYEAGGILEAQNFPQSQLPHAGGYSNPWQTPSPREPFVGGGDMDVGVDSRTGEMQQMASGGIAGYAKGNLTSSLDFYSQMLEGKRDTSPPSGKSDPGAGYAGDVYYDMDPDTRYQDALTAAQIRQAKVNKRANMQLPAMKRPTPMGSLNLRAPGAQAEQAQSSLDPENAAHGGIMQAAGRPAHSTLGGYAAGGNPRLLKGPGDGMSDNIPATIAGKQPARLADGEFVVPADVVSHLGNGSTEAGAKKLHAMMTNVRKARTGNPKQGKQINPNKFMPK